MRKASGDNFTIDLEHGVAIVRVYRRTDLGPAASADQATQLLPKTRSLVVASDVLGLVIDLRRVGGAVSPEIERVYGQLVADWETSGQPVAMLVADPVQRMQLGRLVSEHAPRFGGLFSDREEARKFAGATGSNPQTSVKDLLHDRPSRFRGGG